jgi:dihydroneopterin aldolase
VADDRIMLRGLRVVAYCGVLEEEQARRQPFEINVEIVADLTAAGRSDDLGDTVNYGTVSDRIGALAAEGRFALLEHFAQKVADIVLTEPKALATTVEIAKLRPPVAHDLASSAVRITRSR